MYRGFPLALIHTLRCPHDGGALAVQDEGALPAEHIVRATLRCALCDREYGIERGIVHLLDSVSLDPESSNERTRRDEGARGLDSSWEMTPWNEMEILPTMEASAPLAGACVLELGAGTGRHTVHMATRGASIVAVDFSLGSLENLAARIQPEWDIGLVHADCTQFAALPDAFDLVASTLVSNLPTAQHRAAMMRVAATACKPSGKFVFGTHHFGIRSRLLREPRSGYYREVPIYRYMFRRKEIEAETRAYFADVTCHPIRIAIPLAARMRLPVVKLSRLTERVPLINEFGELLLTTARHPNEVSGS
jgi:SAM-dependent methyltransferase